MEEMGMTDLQFKSFLKLLINQLKEAKEKGEKEEIVKALEKTIEDLNEMLRG